MDVYCEGIDRAIEYLKKNADLKGFDRTVLLRIGDEEAFLRIENSDIRRTCNEKQDITIEMSDLTFKAIENGELRPLKAYALRKMKIKASVNDLRFMTKLLK